MISSDDAALPRRGQLATNQVIQASLRRLSYQARDTPMPASLQTVTRGAIQALEIKVAHISDLLLTGGGVRIAD